ncbi:putative beta-1,4-xylosyltransferase IRX9 [Iris pallida]|uniref:Glycosyltransferases n=1 Tax=Iris pallida TaxID=29817 RepID=A0AAX6I7E2_IRIPA|nr:putative beta-1,4-xylosyltransferase IRX9 [Iris pallida]
MGSVDRSKKRVQLWKKAALRFSLFFVMGFFTGFAPTSTAPLFSGHADAYRTAVKNLGISAKPSEAPHKPAGAGLNRSLMMSKTSPAETPSTANTSTEPLPMADDDEREEPARNLVMVVTTTRSGDRLQGPLLRRLAGTLKLVPPPLLWLVVEAAGGVAETAGVLRDTGVMYRHLTYKENFTDPVAETDHQRNVALGHIDFHRLTGIVHFADVANVYDLEFFEEIRKIEVFGAWAVATVSASRKGVVVEGPVCSSTKVVGWQSKDLSGGKIEGTRNATKPTRLNIFGFAFNSSILWDPERWGRSLSVPDTSQDSVKFVQEVVLEDESKLRGIPTDCTKVMLWHLTDQGPPLLLTPIKSKTKGR